MASKSFYLQETPEEVKNAKVGSFSYFWEPQTLCLISDDDLVQGLHLVTMNTESGQKTQILLEELSDMYGTKWSTTLMSVYHHHHVKTTTNAAK